MKKIIILGTIITTISSNNALAMLLLGRLKQTPKRPLIIMQQQRSTYPPSKKIVTTTPNIFNTPLNSSSDDTIKELLKDHNKRNEKLKILLAAHKKSSQLIEGDVAEQTSIINNTLSLGQPVPVAALDEIEKRLRNRIGEHISLGGAIIQEADRLHKIETTRSMSNETTIFNAQIDSLPKNEVYGLLEDLYDRNQSIAKVIETQQNIAVDHTFYEVPLNMERLKEAEMTLKDLLKE